MQVYLGLPQLNLPRPASAKFHTTMAVLLQVESLELARDSSGANHKRELAAAQRDAAQAAAQHQNAVASLHTDLDWHKAEVQEMCSAGIRMFGLQKTPSSCRQINQQHSKLVNVCSSADHRNHVCIASRPRGGSQSPPFALTA